MLAACVGRKAKPYEAYHTALQHGQGVMGDVIPAEYVDQLYEVEDMTYDELKSTGFVLDTYLASSWCFLKEESAEDAIIAAVNLGDDADTAGAVTGALVGAYYGFFELPKRWRDAILEKELLDEVSEDLVHVARREGEC